MREVISLHIGQAGIQIGAPLWKSFCNEHGVALDGTIDSETAKGDGFTSYFTQTGDSKCIPNAILFDLDPTSVGECSNNSIKQGLFNSSQFFCSDEDGSNVFSRGYYLSQTKMGAISDRISTMLEGCDSFQGFMLFRSAGGGTGSGMGACILEQLANVVKESCKIELAIYPSKVSAVVEPYNAVLGIHKTMNNINCSFMVDNDALYNAVQRRFRLEKANYSDVNEIVARAISTITASVRFEGPLNVDLTEFQTNLVPFPRLHFPFMCFAPVENGIGKHEQLSVKSMTISCFNPSNRLLSVNTDEGQYISCCLIYRGHVSPQDASGAMSYVRSAKLVDFVSWSPTGFKVGFNRHPPNLSADRQMPCLAMMASSTSLSEYFKTLTEKFDLMFKKGAFVHWYYGEGMEEQEFREAREDIGNLQAEYNKLKD